MNSDLDVMRYFPAPLSRAESDRMVDRIERQFDERGYGLWAIEIAATGEFIGFAGLNPMPDGVPGEGHSEVGWRLARGAWRQGYATEAGAAAIRVGIDEIGMGEIWSITAVVNKPSEAVMQRLGMQRSGEFEHPRLDVGHELCRHVAYRTTRVPVLIGRS